MTQQVGYSAVHDDHRQRHAGRHTDLRNLARPRTHFVPERHFLPGVRLRLRFLNGGRHQPGRFFLAQRRRDRRYRNASLVRYHPAVCHVSGDSSASFAEAFDLATENSTARCRTIHHPSERKAFLSACLSTFLCPPLLTLDQRLNFIIDSFPGAENTRTYGSDRAIHDGGYLFVA